LRRKFLLPRENAATALCDFFAAIFSFESWPSSQHIFARFGILQCRRADINPHFDSVNIADIP